MSTVHWTWVGRYVTSDEGSWKGTYRTYRLIEALPAVQVYRHWGHARQSPHFRSYPEKQGSQSVWTDESGHRTKFAVHPWFAIDTHDESLTDYVQFLALPRVGPRMDEDEWSLSPGTYLNVGIAAPGRCVLLGGQIIDFPGGWVQAELAAPGPPPIRRGSRHLWRGGNAGWVDAPPR